MWISCLRASTGTGGLAKSIGPYVARLHLKADSFIQCAIIPAQREKTCTCFDIASDNAICHLCLSCGWEQVGVDHGSLEPLILRPLTFALRVYCPTPPTMAAFARDPELTALPTIGHGDLLTEEKVTGNKADSVEVLNEKEGKYLENSLDGNELYDEDDVVLLKGEPVVTNGKDVSRFVVDVRDDGEQALTFRSLFLGTVLAGLGAALCQVRIVIFSFHAHVFDRLPVVRSTYSSLCK